MVNTINSQDPLLAALQNVRAVVMANSFEYHSLWSDHHEACKWRQGMSGYMPTIGSVADRSVVLSLRFAAINGVQVMFVDPCSQLVDYAMVDEWLTTYCNPQFGMRQARWDAGDFFYVLQATQEIMETQ